MLPDQLTCDLLAEIDTIPLIDPHSHIDPHKPTARGLYDILGYHYYTELAHSAGMDKAPLAADVPPRRQLHRKPPRVFRWTVRSQRRRPAPHDSRE